MLKKHTIKVTTTGSAGAATGSAQLNLGRAGAVRFVGVDYHASAPGATTDVTIKADSSSGAALLTLTNTATDVSARPVGMPAMDEAGAAVAATDGVSGGLPFGTGLHFAVAGCDALTNAVVLSVWIET